jgi:hypothetical protein
VFVTPLTVVYLLGMYTRVHHRSWIIGMLAGAGYGLVRMFWGNDLPLWFADKYAAYLWSAGITVTVMLVVSAAMGWESGEEELEQCEVCESPFGERVPGWAQPEIWAVALLAGILLIIVLVMW